MHWIIRHILRQLAFADTLSYTELKPNQVEGNLFQYYARTLERQGLLNRSSRGYTLTTAGKNAVAKLSYASHMQRREYVRPTVMVVATNNQDDWLLFRWRRHPYRGLVSLPFGRHLAGRSIYEMAADELFYKTGYRATLTALGSLSIITGENHLVSQVFLATNLTGSHGSDGLTGTSFWGCPDDIPPDQALPHFHPIIEWAANPSRPYMLELSD